MLKKLQAAIPEAIRHVLNRTCWYNAASGEVSRNPADMYPSHPHDFSIKSKRERACAGSCLWKIRVGLHMTSKLPERSKTKAGERQTNNKHKSLQEAKSSSGMCRSRAQDVALPENNRGYLDVCFGFLGCGRPEVDGRWGGGGHSWPLAIHHGPVFDSPNACSWAASSIIHGYRRPGRSRAFYFSRVNNSCPLTQPRESRNRGTDKQGSRWLVEPVRTSTLFWFGSQRGSFHAHGPAASHREPARDGLSMLEGSVPELPGQLTSFWGINGGLCWG